MSEDYRTGAHHISGHDWLGWAYLKEGRLAEATREREKVAELSQRSGPQLSGVGYLYAITGRRAEALEILKEIAKRYDRGEAVGQHLAAIWEGLGDRDQAFAWLENDFQQHSAELQFIPGGFSLNIFAVIRAMPIWSSEWDSRPDSRSRTSSCTARYRRLPPACFFNS